MLCAGTYLMFGLFFFLMIRRPPRSTLDRSSAASDVYKRQALMLWVMQLILENSFTPFLHVLSSNTGAIQLYESCLLYTSPSPRDRTRSRMPSSA